MARMYQILALGNPRKPLLMPEVLHSAKENLIHEASVREEERENEMKCL